MTFYDKVKLFTKATAECSEAPRSMTRKEFAFLKTNLLDEIKEVEDAFEQDVDLLTEQMDGVIDIMYYCMNAVAKLGVDLDPLIDIVCHANNSKIVDGKVVRDQDPNSPRYGKILKPEGWEEPQPLMQNELNKQVAQYLTVSEATFDTEEKGGLLKSLKAKAGHGSN